MVWTKAMKDTIGLQKYFETNRENYVWGERVEANVYTCANYKVVSKLKRLLWKKSKDMVTIEEIQESIGPEVTEVRASFSALVEERSSAQKAADLFARYDKLVARKTALFEEEEDVPEISSSDVTTGIPESVAHAFSTKVSEILTAWHFPGECHVYYDKKSSDFVIDGKPRSSRGKGLRAITHAAVNIALLEFCQANGLSHPGFVVLDSPLLAYFKPEGDEDIALKGTDLKERFYDYLIKHHAKDSQVIIIENQHPPVRIEDQVSLTVFTGNPSNGRFGLL